MIFKTYKQIKNKLKTLKQTPEERRHSLVGPAHLWKMKQDFQINFLKNQNLKTTDVLMDIGCGTLRGGIPLIKYLNNGNYYGIEVRENVLNEGKKELEKYNLASKNPTLISFNKFNNIKTDRKFHVMFAFSVLIHLEDIIAEECIEFVSNNLLEDGTFYANINTEKHQDGNWQGFPVVFRSINFYKDLARKHNLKTEEMGTLRDLGHYSGQELADSQIMLKFKKHNKKKLYS